MSAPDMCGTFSRDCAIRHTPPLYGADYLRVCRMAEQKGRIKILQVKVHGHSGWVVTYYGPELSFPQTAEPQNQNERKPVT